MDAERCHAPLDVPVACMELAIALSARSANAGTRPFTVQCEFLPHSEGDHGVHVLYVNEQTGTAAWVFWRDGKTDVQVKYPCPETDERGKICLLCVGHPTGHVWPGRQPRPVKGGPSVARRTGPGLVG
ncbi:hypothetical protein GCM10018987_56450 [Streptomyces cremeus]